MVNCHRVEGMRSLSVGRRGWRGTPGLGGIWQQGRRRREGWGSASGKSFLCFSEKEQAARSKFQAIKDRNVLLGVTG